MDSITLQLDHMAYGGDAIGRYAGQAIFVLGGIAGETVRVEIVEQHDRFSRARLIEVLEPSAQRVEPRCPHFGFDPNSCGGCQGQHIAYAAQLQFKTQIVREQFQRIGRLADANVRDTIPSPNAWAYRNHVRFTKSAEGPLGFQAARSNRVVPIEACYIVEPPILDWLQANESAKQRVSESANLQINSVDDQVDVRLSYPQLPSSNPSTSLRTGFQFQVSPDSFFQVNSSLISTLVEQVLNKLDPKSSEVILDAYCGVGLFTRFIAPKAARVIGIESSRSAIDDARQNLSEFKNVKLLRGLVERILPTINNSIDAAVVDPPRAGCGRQVVQALIDHRVKHLVYVSCDPSTLARDARQLINSGYQLIEAQPIDLFPQTYHIETVALFVRTGE